MPETFSPSTDFPVRALYSAYGGYQRGKLAESDQGLREEVRRRSEMVKSHLTTVHDIAHTHGRRELRDTLLIAMNSCMALSDDAKFSTSHTPNTNHDAQPKIPRKKLKALVEHDLDTLQRLVKCVNIANELEEGHIEDADWQSAVRSARTLNQSLTSARNHFRERNMILDGLMKKR